MASPKRLAPSDWTAHRAPSVRRILAIAAMAFLELALTHPAAAQESTPVASTVPTDSQVKEAVESVGVLLARNRPAEALGLIRPIANARPDSKPAIFAQGMAALAVADAAVVGGGLNPRKEPQKGHYDLAVKSFRAMLVKDPSLQRVRLELGRALFSRGECTRPPRNLAKHILGDDCWASQQHFLRVLSSGVPPSVVLTVRRYIQTIRARKRASGSLSLALAPDTNVNTATAAQTVSIFGLPFQLDADARARSGIGVVGALGADFQNSMPTLKWLPGKVARLRYGANIFRRDYSGGIFDDSNYGVFVGPRFIGDRGETSVLFQADRRQVNGRPYSRQVGVRVESARLATRKMWVGGTVELSRMTPLNAQGVLDSPGLGLNGLGYVSYALFPSLTVRGMAGYSREKTGRLATRHQSRWVGVNATYDLPYGFNLIGAQQFFFTRYDEPLRLFSPEPPKTTLWFSRLALHNRLLNFKGFSPSVSVIREERHSNLTLYTYNRYRVEGGVVRVF